MIVANVGRGMRWTRWRRHVLRAHGRTTRSRTAKSCGPDAPTLASSRRGWPEFFLASRRRWWQESPITKESAKETVKTIAQGMPGVFRWTCGD